MSFSFHPDAEAELVEAIQYYENIEPGLGQDFTIEAYSAIQRAIAHPRAWAAFEDDIRRSLLNRFPYGILYSEDDDGILIVAVMHLHREPGYWMDRV